MKPAKYIVIFLMAVLIVACNETVYTDYTYSPLKSSYCDAKFAFLPCSDNSVVSIVENEDSSFVFVKQYSDGTLLSVPFELEWDYTQSNNGMQDNNGENNRDDNNADDNPNNDTNNGDNSGDDSNGDTSDGDNSSTGTKSSTSKQTSFDMVSSTYVDLSQALFRKNINDEYFLEVYSTNNFGRVNYAVVKFDSNGEIVFKVDSVVAANGNMNGANYPVGGTPLNNGGYAMILQSSSGGMMGMSSSSDFILRVLDENGQTINDYTISNSESVSIQYVGTSGNNIMIFYQTSTSTLTSIMVVSSEGELQNTISGSYTRYVLNVLPYDDMAFVAGYDNSQNKSYLVAIDNLGNEISETFYSDTSLVFTSVNVSNQEYYVCGFTYPIFLTSFSSLSNLTSLTNCSGKILKTNTNGSIENSYTLDYDLGILASSVFNNTYGGYCVFTQSYANIAEYLGYYIDESFGRVYIFTTEQLENLDLGR